MNYKKDSIAYENVRKYSVPPSWEIIEEFIKEVGINKYHFEKFYGISHNHLAKVKTGAKQLGRLYWHIFYEKIKMPHGVGFPGIYNELYKATNKLPKKILKKVPKANHINIGLSKTNRLQHISSK